jgi:hypothetical protein
MVINAILAAVFGVGFGRWSIWANSLALLSSRSRS